MKEIAIRAEELFKVYREDGVEVKAVRGVSLEIEKGEFTALVGPSGSGKTTLFNLLSGLDKPDKGRVWLSGKDISRMSGDELSDFRKEHVGFVFQAYNLIPVLTVFENIEFILLLQGVKKEERRERVSQVLSQVGLEGYEDRFPPKLSGGQQQRVSIARAIVGNPDIVLADEPTANLDSETSIEIIELMKRLNEEKGVTFLFATHDPLVMERARRILKMRDGKIVEDEKKG